MPIFMQSHSLPLRPYASGNPLPLVSAHSEITMESFIFALCADNCYVYTEYYVNDETGRSDKVFLTALTCCCV